MRKSKPRLAKLTRPKLHNVLARERLFALLDGARQRALTWVVGPPGAGKTALVASYLEEEKLKGTWYHLDTSDHDPATFFHYLSQTLEPRDDKTPLPVIGAEHRADLPAFARYYFREFFARLAEPSVVVFDNYHEIPADSLLHGVIEQAALEAPEGVSLTIISREEPPAQFARLEALDRLARVEWNDLKLTLAEATAIAALRFELDAPTLRSLYEISKGWAAGLTLALERMKRSGGELRHIQGEALESVFNYFAAQIFNSAAPDVREFLMLSALPRNTNADMAAQITGHPNAANLLEYFYRRRLFTDRRGEPPYSYQYHDLFRAFLLDQLTRNYAPATLGAQRRRAGEILEKALRHNEAVALYEAASDWDSVVRLTLEHAPTLLAQGRGETLREWIKVLPEQFASGNPWLSYWFGISLLAGAPDEARAPLKQAYWQLQAQGDASGELACCSAIASSYLSDLTDFRPMGEWIDRLVLLLRAKPVFQSAVAELQINAALASYAHFCRPRADFYEPAVQRGLQLLATDMPIDDKMVPACLIVFALREAGRIKECDQIMAPIRPLLTPSRVNPGNIAYCWQVLAWLATSRGDRGAALAACESTEQTCNAHAIMGPARHIFTHLLLGAIAVQTRDLDAAEAHINKMESFLNPDRCLERGWGNWIRSIVAAMRDDWDNAIKFAQNELAILLEGSAVFQLYYAYLHLAGGLIGSRRFAEAAEAIENARAILIDSPEFRNLADVDFVAAWSAARQGDTARFDQYVRDALAILKRSELHACLWYMDQRIMPEVLNLALNRGIEPQQARELIRQLALQPPTDAGQHWPWPIKLYSLGCFEVLRDDAPLEASRKPAKKPLALLKLLACAGGAPVPVSHALDALWPESEADAAEKSFDAALHRLRAMLRASDAIKLSDGRLSLDRAQVWVDAWAFEALCRQGNGAAEAAAHLYRGTLLPDELDAPWSVSYREKLHHDFNRLICTQAAALESQDGHAEALEWYARGLERDDLVEAMYQGIMRCHLHLGRRADALATFQRLRRTLSSKLRTSPSAESAALAAHAEASDA
jgi:ATP/maltotriose-dependent transcriptional regulator MalT/DNA-binding SARP family transcriptional activator